MKILFLINDAPYGTEVLVFLMSDAVTGALVNHNTPQGYYNIERMLKAILDKGGKVKLCGSCIDARGLAEVKYLEGCVRSNMAELGQWSVEADKVFTF